MTPEKNESTENASMKEFTPAAENGNLGKEPSKEKLPPKKSTLDILVRHWRLVGVLLLVLAVAGTYLWKNVAVSRAKAQLTRQAAVVIASHNESYLRLVALPLVWVVRSEMLRGNYDQVNQYLSRFVRQPNMKEVLVARADGRVVAATNKQREGAPASNFFPPEALRTDSITVTPREGGDIMVAAPIMGLNDKLGVLILVATPPAYSLETASR